jgi:O-antigen/teichoic acid export membrane protein
MTTETEPVRAKQRDTSKGFLRGSSLLLVGRVISIGINFFVQVLAARYLLKAEYGSLQWAISLAAIGSSVALLGFNRGVGRFTALHHERREYDEMFGTIFLSLGTVAGLGVAIVLLVLGLQGVIAEQVQSELSVALLLVIVALVPIDALDALFETLIAVFAGARSIFWRRYVLAPGLKLMAVLGVMAVGGSPQLLAIAYVGAGLIGTALYLLILWRALSREGLLASLDLARVKLPVRTMFLFCLPLLTTDLILAIETPLVVVFLERFRDTEAVADLTAASKVAVLCLLVFQNSKILFRPQATRLFARGDEAALGDLYWRTAAWITVVTFPVFAACMFLAEPIMTLLFGQDYATASVLLAILAAGKFFNSALGMNTFTLQVYGRVRPILVINVVTALLTVCLCLWLVPAYGAVGGAIATSAAIVIRNLAYQSGLIATTKVGLLTRDAARVYGSVLVAVAALALLKVVTDATLPPWGAILVALGVVAASLFVPWHNRRFLAMVETFPELAKLPVIGPFLARLG